MNKQIEILDVEVNERHSVYSVRVAVCHQVSI